MSDVEGFCVLCGVDVASFKGLSRCPNCDTKSIPCNYSNQVNIEINTHELRILCIWAERYALDNLDSKPDGYSGGGSGVVYSICDRLREKNGSLEEMALTLRDEIGEIKETFPGTETNFPGIEK